MMENIEFGCRLLEDICEHLEIRANDPWPDKLWPAAHTAIMAMVAELREEKEYLIMGVLQ